MKKIITIILLSVSISYSQEYVYITKDTLSNTPWVIDKNITIQGKGNKPPELLILSTPQFIIKNGASVILDNVVIRNRNRWVKIHPKSEFMWKRIMPGNVKGHLTFK